MVNTGSASQSPNTASVEITQAAFGSGKTGNIFTTEDALEFSLSFTVNSDDPPAFSISYEVADHLGGPVAAGVAGQAAVTGGNRRNAAISFDIDRTGVFTLSADIASADGAEYQSYSTEFCRLPPLAKNRDGGFFGACTHFGQNKGDTEISTGLLALGGFSLIRDDIGWTSAETVKGVVNIPHKWDVFVDAALAAGLEPLLIFDYGNKLYDEGGIPYSEEGRAAFVRYTEAVAKHFLGRVRYYEVWNEPNLIGHNFNPTSQNAATYTKLLREVYTAVKAIAPDAAVLGGSLAGTDIKWLRDMMEAGAYGYMDALSIHPYSWPDRPEKYGLAANLDLAYSIMASYGDEPIPLWITEIGWPTHEHERGVDELTSANYLVRSVVQSLSTGFVDKYFWYVFQDDTPDEKDAESRFGLIRHNHEYGLPWGAKAGYAAGRILADKLRCAGPSGFKLNVNSAYLYKFDRDDGQVLVAWDSLAPREVTLATGDGVFTVTDIFGNESALSATDGKINVTLSVSPLYIEGNFSVDIAIDK